MARNLSLQILRGALANIPSLVDGEFYFATDKGQLYVGFGGLNFKLGTGMATVQIQDGAGNSLTSTAGALDINLKTDGVTALPISADALPLPTGAAIETGGNLASIAANTSTIATNTANETNGSQKTQVSDPSSLVAANVSAKGVQGSNALAVQNLIDSGRTFAVFSATITAAAANTETLASLVELSESPAGTLTTAAAATNFTVPSGKRFRIQSLLMSVTDITTAEVSGSARITLRVGNNAVITTASPALAVASANFVMATAVLGQSASANVPLPDGLELSGTENFGISYLASTVECSVTIILIGYFY